MGDRENFLMECVISVASDDYESFAVIFEQTSRLGLQKGIYAPEAEVATAIERAIAGGFAQAYVLSPHEPHSVKVEYSIERLGELWFYVTPHGKRAAKSIPELSGENN